jgi:hypothetical protein
MNSISIRLYKPGDETQIVTLLNLVFQPWPGRDLITSSLEHWRWKFLDNGFKEKKFAIVAQHQNKIIGCEHSRPTAIKIFDKTRFCRVPADSAMHPEYRGKGIWSRMWKIGVVDLKGDDFYLQYNSTNNPIVENVYKKRGNQPFPLPVLNCSRIRNKRLHYEKTKSKISLNLIMKNIRTILRENRFLVDTSKPQNNFKGTIEEHEFDKNYNTFWDLISREYEFIIDRNSRYVNWRYNDPRGGLYQTFFALEDDSILGLLVLRLNKIHENYPTGHIVDVLVFPERPDVYDMLLRKATDFFDELGVNCIFSWVLKGHPWEQIDKSHGFRAISRVGSYLVPNRVGEKIHDLLTLEPSKIHFTLGDSDWI